MSQKSAKRTILSFTVTLAAVLLMVFVAPVQAVQLNLAAPSSANEGDTVGFDLGLDIAPGERVPFSNITLQISGPISKTCTFALNGTPLSDCQDMNIYLTTNAADYGYGYQYGYGYNGTSSENTTFGYGYGYGYGVSGSEFFWRVEWNTSGVTPGNYTVNYYASADGRTYNLENPHSLVITGTPAPSADLIVQNGYPQGADYSFECTNNFGADTFDWNFGDGSSQTDSSNEAVFHTFHHDGIYTVYCAATRGATTAEDTLQVNVSGTDNTGPAPGTTGVQLTVKPGFPQGGQVVYQCTGYGGFSPVTYDWNYGDGQVQYDISNDNTFHTYTADGTYTASCSGTDNNGTTYTDWRQVTISGAVTPPGGIDLHVEDWFPQGNNYSFACDTPGTTPDSYDWEIRNLATGEREYLEYDIANSKIWHRFLHNTDYEISCAATTGATTLMDSMRVHVSGAPDTPVAEPISGNNTTGTVTLVANENGTTLVVAPDSTHDMNIVVPVEASEIKIDLSSLVVIVGSEKHATLPVSVTFDVTTPQGHVLVDVPAGTTVYSTLGWNGILTLPTMMPSSISGTTSSIEVGAGDTAVWFDKAVSIRFDNRSGQNAAYVRNSTTTTIDDSCSANDQTTMDTELTPVSGDCKISVGSDLVVWTKHFTQFVTYTSSSRSGGSGRSLDYSSLPGYVSGYQQQSAAPAQPEQAPTEEQPPTEGNNAPVIENVDGEGAAPAEAQAASDTPETPAEAPAITGRATGSGAVPQWLIVLGSFTLIAVVVIALVVRMRKH